MPFNSCDPCCNPLDASRSKETWRHGVLVALCDLVQSTLLTNIETDVMSGLEVDMGETSIIPAPGAGLSIHVFSSKVMTLSTSALQVTFLDGSGGQTMDEYLLQTVAGLSTGGNLAVTPPGYLYKLTPNTPLVISLSSAQLVSYTIGYFIK